MAIMSHTSRLLPLITVAAASCGSYEKRELTFDGLQRHYVVYIPASMCRDRPNVDLGVAVDRSTHLMEEEESVPLVIAMHCFGCEPSNILSIIKSAADQHKMVLVAPEGVENSFNSVVCCGPAMESGLNDVGFTRAVVKKLSSELGHDVKPRVRLDPKALYAMGFSNGGFMASLLGMHMPELRGFVAMAGHMYNVSSSMRSQAVSLHWIKQDKMVNYDGCCPHTQDDASCCCNIGSRWGGKCVGVKNIFRTWLEVNECTGSSKSTLRSGVECEEGLNCKRPTHLCEYAEGVHQQWANEFQDVATVGTFLAKDICGLGGVWDPVDTRCTRSSSSFRQKKSMIQVASLSSGAFVKLRRPLGAHKAQPLV